MQKRVNHVRWHQKPKLERTFWTDSSDKNTKLEILFGNTLKAVTIRLSRLLNHVNLNWFGFFTDKNSHGFDKARKYA